MTARRLGATALAAVLGVALAVLLFPSAPPSAPPAPPPSRAPSRVAPELGGAPAPREETPAPATAPTAAPPLHQSLTHPPPPNLPGLAEARKKDVIARHAEIDAARWAGLGEILAQSGYGDLATRARAMALDLGRITGSRDPGARDLLDEERQLTVDVRESAALPLVEDRLGPIEQALNAAQQGGIHPADMPPPP